MRNSVVTAVAAVGAAVSAVGEVNSVGTRFRNTEPGTVAEVRPSPGMVWEMVTRGGAGAPPRPVPLVRTEWPAQAAELAVTWLGHSTTLLEVDGFRVLTDPIWSTRCSPSTAVGPARLHAAPVPLSAVPPVDAVVISHDHYDHLDKASILQLVREQTMPFLVPTGVGAHLRRWGVPAARIRELGWNEAADIDGLTVTCTEARHFSGRGLVRNTTLWSSWAVAGPTKRVYFGGDTGYTAAFAEIGAQHGPFDVTVLPIGAYNDMWPDIHMNPEEAVQAHLDLNSGAGGVLLPVHWATFNLAFHSWAEPVERLLAAAEPNGIAAAIPRPGQRITPVRPTPVEKWWRKVAADV